MKDFINYCRQQILLSEGVNEEEFLKYAISEHFPIKFVYDGYQRTVVDPYIMGKSLKGNIILRAYQNEGQSSKDKLGWRTFTVDKMKNIELLKDEPYKIRDDYTGSDRLMTSIVIAASMDENEEPEEIETEPEEPEEIESEPEVEEPENPEEKELTDMDYPENLEDLDDDDEEEPIN